MQSTHLLCPNCEKNHFMLKKLRLIPMIVSAVTVMLCCLVPQSAHATLYSYVTVKTDNYLQIKVNYCLSVTKEPIINQTISL